MHPALFLEEILRVIFTHCYNQLFEFFPEDRPLADLLSLARTCRAFKEPALDVLWMNVYDLSRLVRPLPSACRVTDLGGGKHIYALDRDLELAEVDTVKAYARRVRALVISSEDGQPHLDPDTLEHLCRTTQTEPLFPNLRLLSLTVVNDDVILSRHVAVPNLRDLRLIISTSTPSSCEGFMRSLSSSSLDIQNMSVRFRGGWSLSAFSNIMNQHFRHWTRLQSMECPDMTVDIDTLSHLSRTTSLTQLLFTLDFALIDQIGTSNRIFTFPALKSMTLNTTSMVPDSRFFCHLRLPTLETISVYYIDTFPSRGMIRSLAIALQTACNHEFVKNITLEGSRCRSPWGMEPTALVLEEVLPLTVFHLTHMRIDIDWIVDLKDADLLQLASDCPQIESLLINQRFGWRSAGITPSGLVQVLRRCPLLRTFCIALDTRESQTLTSDGPVDPLPSGTCWVARLADSIIEAKSVPTLAAFFADCMPTDGVFFISGWDSRRVRRLHADWRVYQERWDKVSTMAQEIVLKRSKMSDRPQPESL